jgi:hypothetical protein
MIQTEILLLLAELIEFIDGQANTEIDSKEKRGGK